MVMVTVELGVGTGAGEEMEIAAVRVSAPWIARCSLIMRMVTVELGMVTVELWMVTVELGMVTGAGKETSAVEELEVAAVGERETIKMVTMAMSYNMDQ